MMDIRVKHYVPNPKPTMVDVETSGFVKGGGVKFIVTDDLSSVSSKCRFSFLEYFKAMNIVDLNGLEEKIVNVNVEKCKDMLKLALTSNHMVLTNLFKDELGF
ncbi:hypothetical protein L6452_14313 [Arctium lappa]|uniref:Uncharacterized protein n=1 Tax=Arctium lappa TaxID=4217 RepID=A0ACB9CKJ6_ARCLA|nr:hypothetical protein L6452_14313 [Arctium lappa]